MTEKKFTPGPWKYKKGRKSQFEWDCLFTAKRGRVFLFGCDGLSDEDSHLIAAAPELYEALEATLEQDIGCFQNHYGEDPSGTPEPEYIQKARAALAKARGETP